MEKHLDVFSAHLFLLCVIILKKKSSAILIFISVLISESIKNLLTTSPSLMSEQRSISHPSEGAGYGNGSETHD